MIVDCENCGNLYSQKPKSRERKGSFALCYHCRKETPKKYLCKGVNAKGNPCGQIRKFDSETCGRHVVVSE